MAHGVLETIEYPNHGLSKISIGFGPSLVHRWIPHVLVKSENSDFWNVNKIQYVISYVIFYNFEVSKNLTPEIDPPTSK